MKGILGHKEFPFILTLLFGLLGYHINEITKSILSSPSIEYDFKVTESKNINDTAYKSYEYVITNITTDKSFNNLTINFESKNNSQKIFNPATIAIEPSSLHFITPESLDKRLLVYEILTFQPGDKYKLTFQSISQLKDVDSNPSLYLTSTNTVRIIRTSFITWLVKNYIIVNTILLTTWIMLILLYLFKLKKNENTCNVNS